MEKPSKEETEASAEAKRQLVVDFLLQERYTLTAFELLHELLEDGQLEAAARLQTHFADQELYPPEQMFVLQSIQVDNQKLLDDKEAAVERAAVMEYELRLAREDIKTLEEKLEAQAAEGSRDEGPVAAEEAKLKDASGNTLGRRVSNPDALLVQNERRDINCAVKQYLVAAGYKLTAMTFCEEVVDQDLDQCPPGPAQLPSALRSWYQHFISTTIEEAEQLRSAKEELLQDKERLQKEAVEGAKVQEALRKDLAQRDKQVRQLKEKDEAALKELNAQSAEISALKVELEQACRLAESLKAAAASLESGVGKAQPPSDERPSAAEGDDATSRAADAVVAEGEKPAGPGAESNGVEANGTAEAEEEHGPKGSSNGSAVAADTPNHSERPSRRDSVDEARRRKEQQEVETVFCLAETLPKIVPNVLINKREELLPLIICAIERHPDSKARDSLTHGLFNLIKRPDEPQRRIIMNACIELAKRVGPERTENELLPQCWGQIDHKYAERRLLVAQSCGEIAPLVRPEIRASLILSILSQLADDTSAIVREAVALNLALLMPLLPDLEKHAKVEELCLRLVCDPSGEVVEVSLAKLMPCLVDWGHKGHRPLTSLLHAVLSRLLNAINRCQPASGVEASVEAHQHVLGERERWHVDTLLRLLAQLLPDLQKELAASMPLSVGDLQTTGVEAGAMVGSVEEATGASKALHPRKLSFGERRMSQAAPSRRATEDDSGAVPEELSEANLRAYASNPEPEWPAYDWLGLELIPALLQLACMLQPREEALRMRLCQLLLSMWHRLGKAYLQLLALRMVFAAAGSDPGDLVGVPPRIAEKIRLLRPTTLTGEKIAKTGVLPLLLAGVLGAREMQDGMLADYVRDLVLSTCLRGGAWSPSHTPELLEAIRFLCTFEEQHAVILGVLWELVVNPTPSVKVTAAVLLGSLATYVDMKMASQQVLPALITLGSDPNVEVKHASILALGAVAQHFKDDAIVDKIRVQMDSFLEDGSHEAMVAVLRALTAAVPVTTASLREYLLQKVNMLALASNQTLSLALRKEKADILCQAIRALDGVEISATAAKDVLVPAAQALLRDPEALDAVQREALETTVRERSGGKLAAISSVMMTNFNKSSMGTFFSSSAVDSSLLLSRAKSVAATGSASSDAPAAASASEASSTSPTPQKTSPRPSLTSLGHISDASFVLPAAAVPAGAAVPQRQTQQPPAQEESRLKRMMRSKYEEMLKFRSKPQLTAPPSLPPHRTST